MSERSVRRASPPALVAQCTCKIITINIITTFITPGRIFHSLRKHLAHDIPELVYYRVLNSSRHHGRLSTAAYSTRFLSPHRQTAVPTSYSIQQYSYEEAFCPGSLGRGWRAWTTSRPRSILLLLCCCPYVRAIPRLFYFVRTYEEYNNTARVNVKSKDLLALVLPLLFHTRYKVPGI